MRRARGQHLTQIERKRINGLSVENRERVRHEAHLMMNQLINAIPVPKTLMREKQNVQD